jgi:tetratricopeptide (TPR) repeat protein
MDTIAKRIRQYDYHGAIAEIDKIHPDSVDREMLYRKAVSFKALSKFHEAIVCLDSIYRQDTVNLEIIIELADCYKSVLNYKKPQELYKKALILNPGNKFLMQLLAGTYMTLEQYDQARLLYLKACRNDTSVFLLKQLALCYEKIMQDDSAIYCYQRAMVFDPEDYQPVFRLANLYKAQREYDLGIAITDTFLLTNPENRDVSRLSGYLHYLNKDFNGAIKQFRHSINLTDTSAFVHKYLGYSYFKLNEFTNTIRYLEKVYAIDSSDAELCYALGLAHDVPKNIRYFNAAINLGSPVINVLAQVYQDLSLALTKAWRYDEALDALTRASQLVPNDIALLYKIGVHYDNWMDDKPMALKYYRDFMATRSDTSAQYIITGTSVIMQSDYLHTARRIKDIEASLSRAPVVAKDTAIKLR